MTYTAKTVKELRSEAGSLLKKVSDELTNVETEVDGFDRGATSLKITKATIELEGSSSVTLDGDTIIDGAHTLTTGTGDVVVKGDMSIDAGKDFDMSDGAGTLASGTGNVTLKGDVSIDADKDFDMSAGAGTLESGTGNVTLKGDVSIDGGKDFDMSAGDGTFATGTGAVTIGGSAALATTKTYTSGTGSAIGGTHIIYQDGAGAKSFEVIPGTSIDLDETNITLTGAIKLDGEVTLDDDGTIGDVSDVMTLTQDSIILAGAVKLDGTVTLDDDATIEDAANVTTVTQDTIKLVGATAITLDGDSTVDGAHTFGTGTGAVSLNGAMTVADAKDISFNTTTGSKIGTAVDQKIGFYNVTPIVQPAAANQGDQGDMTTVGANSGTSGAGLTAIGNTTTVDQGGNLMNDLVALQEDITALDLLMTEIRTALINVGIMKGSA